MGVGIFFPGAPLVDFFKSFSGGGPKVVKFVFHHSKLRKQLFCRNFQVPAPLPTPNACLCVGKVRATPLKNWCNFKRFNTIQNREILLKLTRKMKYLTDQFQLCLCFCFSIGNTSYILFLHWRHNWHPYRQLACCCSMNEPSKQRTYWRYHCSVTYVTQQRRSSHENSSFIVT